MAVTWRQWRRLAVIAALAALPLLAACGDGDSNPPRPTPTATAQASATATAAPATATATSVPATATAVPPTQTAVPPTATATEVPATATATPSATETATSNPNFRDLRDAAEASFAAHGSVNQVYITGATEGEVLELVGADSVVQQTGTVDAQGALIFRNVDAGASYRVVAGHPGPLSASPALTVTNVDEPPPQEFYSSQTIGSGYGYLQTRDGTLLSINVILPGPIEDGPYATVIEYSGYDPSNPDAPQPSTLIASLLGYAAVGVNIRGTGCSGGAFQFFEPLQWTDGYDAIEVIAAQPWVKNHKVGMVGLSYPGISQLFVSRLQPPSLAAVAPLSTIADTGRGTLYPGGILNNGFAVDWAADRKHDAQPFGQSWTLKRRDAGDQTCIDNQQLRLQSPDILDMIAENAFYVPEVADPLTPELFVQDITVPVFLAHAWQDEQVGGYAPNMLDHFTGTDKKYFTLVNGGHSEPLIPAIFHRWIEFLSFYIRRETPVTPVITNAILAFLGSDIYGASGLTMPPDRFTGMSYAEALAAFEAEKPIRVLFESGAGDPGQPGAPVPGFEASFDRWPIEGTVATPWYFAENGRLSDTPVSTGAIDSFHYDATDAQRGNLQAGHGGNDTWLANAPWDWRPLQDGRAVAYASAPLAQDTVMIGTGSVDLMVRADAPDVDLQVTLSEIRPDGRETYIQNGWLRASRRALDPASSTDLRPVATQREADAAPLPAGQFALVRIELFPFAHAFRAGSRIRISVEPPGNDRAIWKFDALTQEATVEIALDGSRVTLPVVPGVEIPTALPPCNALRGQPCREYEAIDNSVE
jgi:hypothetical protein